MNRTHDSILTGMAEIVNILSLQTHYRISETSDMQIALALYPGFTALDIVGPFQVLIDVPGHDVVWVAATTGPVLDHTKRLPITATHTFADVTTPDVVIVPGGTTYDMDGPLVPWIRKVHETSKWTTSVCTGSIFLAAAGLLEGREATTHWAAQETLNSHGATYREQRVIRQGKIITAAGVSAGIDMALTLLAELHGDAMAQAIQLAIEYDPQPPFNAGSPSKAPAEIVELVKTFGALRPPF
jgi:transcriptional regulator GlxA family with amidase domain